jgi:hypothetical protein
VFIPPKDQYMNSCRNLEVHRTKRNKVDEGRACLLNGLVD